MTKTKSAAKKSKEKSKPKSKQKAEKSRKEKVGAGTLTQETPAQPKKPRPSGMAVEPDDVDEYEVMRQAAVEPYRRNAMPKPGAAGRLFDDEDQLEDYDPLFDDVGEEEDE